MADSTVINNKSSFFSRKLKTVLNVDNHEERAGFDIDDIIDERYQVVDEIGLDSGEADIYIVKDLKTPDAALRVIKIYRRKDAVKEEVLLKLADIDNPAVAKILGRGEVSGFTYLVLPYYSRGSLASYIEQGITFTVEELKNLVIPSVAEGLKALHDAGILHKDLKPGNMMIADDDRHIVLIDFGISSVTAGATMVVTSTGKSPFYAAPETATGLFWSGSDYYSLGISLYELYSGVTPYQNAGADDVARYAQAERIPYPDDFDAELKELIDGLTYKDISYRNEPDNPNRRWGYDEIRKWLDGVRQQVPGSAGTGSGNYPSDAVPYIFKNTKYYSDEEFFQALILSWEDGKKELYRGFLAKQFELQGNTRFKLFCDEAEKNFSKNPEDADAIFFKLIYSMDPGISKIIWKNYEFDDFEQFVSKISAELSSEGDCDHDLISIVRPLTASRALITYLDSVGHPDRIKLRDIIRRISEALNSCPDNDDLWVAQCFIRGISGKRDFNIAGQHFESPEKFNEFMENMHDTDFAGYVSYCNDHADEITAVKNMCIGKDRILFCKDISDSDSNEEQQNIFSFKSGRYVFRNSTEVENYIEHLKSKAEKCDEKLQEYFKEISRCQAEFISCRKEYHELINRYTEYMKQTGRDSLISMYEVSKYTEYLNGKDTYNDVLLPLDTPKLYINSVVTFARYTQSVNGYNSKEPLKWLVLDVNADTGQVLLLSLYGLDFIQYSYTGTTSTWDKSSIRYWLNNNFIHQAFTDEERTMLSTSGTEGILCNDRVFLLSPSELVNFMPKPEQRKCRPTKYASLRWVVKSPETPERDWWLRSDSGVNQEVVSSDGRIIDSVKQDSFGVMVRPAIRLFTKRIRVNPDGEWQPFRL